MRYRHFLEFATIGLLLIGPVAHSPSHDAKAVENAVPTAAGITPQPDWKLLFSTPADVTDVWGTIHFGISPVTTLRAAESPGFYPNAAFPNEDGSWQVYGHHFTHSQDGPEPYDRVAAWRLMRGKTRDGVSFEDVESVLEVESAAWTDNFAMAYNPLAGEYLLLNLKLDLGGAAYHAFFSRDGRQWTEHPGNPLFYDGDAMSMFWSPVAKRFVCVSKSLQPHFKHIRDHGGATPSLNNDALRDRRVLVIRSSADGRVWEPSVSLPDVWNRHGKKGAIAAEHLTMPDELDPPDLEFYSGSAFWHHDRAYMMVLNYAASPLLPLKHGPHVDNEWWVSRDGLAWERPWRGLNALYTTPSVPRLECNPMLVNGMILFNVGNQLVGLKQDRISYLSARTNAEFSVPAFTMPRGGLRLNAAVPAPDREFAAEQAYVMVAVVDEKGEVIPGYEAEKCLLRRVDDIALPLMWNGVSAGQLAGREVSLRFWLRGSNIYTVTSEN